MKTVGTLLLSMYIGVPNLDNDKVRGKRVSLARYHHVTLDEARQLKELFLKENAGLRQHAVDGEWIVREFI